MHQSIRVVLAVGLAAIAACGPEPADEEPPIARGPIADPLMAPAADEPSRGGVGPVRYDWDPERLTRAEIQIELPPTHEARIWVTKLIPAARAATLGEERCRYGAVARVQTCTAEEENGLAMALLERPLADYRATFRAAKVPEAELQPAALAGHRGFRFIASAPGSVTTYGFFPVVDRTLLVVSRISQAGDAPDPAIRDVLDSLRFPDEDQAPSRAAGP